MSILYKTLYRILYRLNLIALKARSTFFKDYYIGENVHFYSTSLVSNFKNNKKAIEIGEETHIRGELKILSEKAKIKIGEYCYIGESSKIWAQEEIIIGDNVQISHNVNIHDTNSHPLNYMARREDFRAIVSRDNSKVSVDTVTKPIIIEDDAWIGFNTTILKGVRIGARSIIGAGSFITKDVPPDVVIAGNPVKIIKNLVY